jgi:hypothetical protein
LACRRDLGNRSKTDRACWQCSISNGHGVTDFHRAEWDDNSSTSALLPGSNPRWLLSFRSYRVSRKFLS